MSHFEYIAENTYDILKTYIDDKFHQFNDLLLTYDYYDGERYTIKITSKTLMIDLININIVTTEDYDEEENKLYYNTSYLYENYILDTSIINKNHITFIEKVKSDIDKLFTTNFYINNYNSIEDLLRFPIFNQKYYLTYVDELLTGNPTYVKIIDFNNLNDTMKTKWEYIFNANKFDLI